MKTLKLFSLFCFSALLLSAQNRHLERAENLLNSIYTHYSIKGTNLLRETFPFDTAHVASYIADETAAKKNNPYSFLWPYSGSLTAVSTVYFATKNEKHKTFFDEKVLDGLTNYYDVIRFPAAYASYINYDLPLSDRYYDDNVWLGIDFTDMYLHSKEPKYLDKAVEIWRFIESGTDDKLGGGIYWCEQKKGGKNTCSNAPGAVYALKLFEATGEQRYFEAGKTLYEWTKQHLQDPADYLYYDNISLRRTRVDKTKYAYNSGQMMQAAALLYKITKQNDYLIDAQRIAKSAYSYFFLHFDGENGADFRLIRKGNVWFSAVMIRGYIELFHLDHNNKYVDAIEKNLDLAWAKMRDENGLFNSDWSGKDKDKSKWLLTQFAIAEMYARLGEMN